MLTLFKLHHRSMMMGPTLKVDGGKMVSYKILFFSFFLAFLVSPIYLHHLHIYIFKLLTSVNYIPDVTTIIAQSSARSYTHISLHRSLALNSAIIAAQPS